MWWIVAVLLLLSGCTSYYSNAMEDAALQYKQKLINSIGDFEVNMEEWENYQLFFNQSQNGTRIYAFVCNTTKIPTWKKYWYYIINLGDGRYLFDPPLLGAYCWIQDVGDLPSWRAIHRMANMTEEEINQSPLFWDMEKADQTIPPEEKLIPALQGGSSKWYERIYTFGLASGPTFADFNNLNPYCNSSLRYSIKFVKGTEERYMIPVAPDKRAACYLDLSVMPTFVFHGWNGFPKIDNSVDLAKKMYVEGEEVGIGPVILITESSLTKDNFFEPTLYSDGSVSALPNVEMAFTQAINLKHACPTCLVGLYIPLGINQSNLLHDPNTGTVKDPQNDLRWIYSQFQSNPLLNESVDIIAFGLDVNELEDPCSWEEMILRMNNMIDFARSLGKMSYIIYINFPLNESCRTERKASPMGYGSAADFLYWYLFRVDPVGNQQYKQWVGRGLMAISLPPLYSLSGSYVFGECENCSLIIQDAGINFPNQPVFSYVLDFCQNYSLAGYTYPIVFSSQNTFLNMGSQAQDAFYRSNITNQTTVISPPRYYILQDKSEPLFMCTGCFLHLTDDQLQEYQSIFDLAEYEYDCDYPSETLDKLKIYAEILDVDLPYLRAIIAATSGFNLFYVSLINPPRQEEKCGYRMTWTDLEDYAENQGIINDAEMYWNEWKSYRYNWDTDECEEGATGTQCVPCGLGLMDVKRIWPGDAGNCGVYEPFNLDSNLCEGMYQLGEALKKSQELLSNNLDLFFIIPDPESGLSEEQMLNYTILWMLFGAIYYDGENASLERAVEWYEESQITEAHRFNDAICQDLSPPVQAICCPDNPYGACGRGTPFWTFLKGMKEAAEDSGRRDLFETYNRLEFGLEVMSYYFSAYDKCDDCKTQVWGENIEERLCQVLPEKCS
ncbi:MAG: hypothetical protein GXN92_01800 [Candidatus Micrarchaeota archaeon]|nr:hypothetical protein [Candidatus Micrarchaeota archaeon]